MMTYVNAALIELSKDLHCENCQSDFSGTVAQANSVKYYKRPVYCSPVCRSAAQLRKLHATLIATGKKPRKGVLAGPCPQCGKMYESKSTDRKYCSMDCYTNSDDFKAMQLENCKHGNRTFSKKMREHMTTNCPVCKNEFRMRKGPTNKRGPTKFCSQLCYRKFRADLFDAWTANPQNLTMPQNYDEFMLQNELPCLVEGCVWHGRHLSVHLNQAHGIRANDFKRAVGFNLSTGLVCPDLHKELSDRHKQGVAINNTDYQSFRGESHPRSYVSKESCEHQKKARALMKDTPGPMRTCDNCGDEFRQASVFGRAKYCSHKCRNKFYYKKIKANATD